MTDAEIVARLEGLRGPDPETDRMIAKALGCQVKEFTKSLDAAASAVPRPAGSMSLATTFSVGGFGDGRPHSAWAKVFHDTSMAGGPPRDPFEAKDRCNPAIALCIASFKAREIRYRK